MDNRLIMLTGSGPSAGKSTVMAEIAKTLRQGAMPALEVDEHAVWGKRQLGRNPVDLSRVASRGWQGDGVQLRGATACAGFAIYQA
jgi:hypothetical protein